jgi:toxin ParE1/3/4
MPRATWTHAAERDLEGIFLFIGRDKRSPLAAAELVRALVGKVETYAAQPLLGQLRPEFGPEIRSFAARRYVIFYRAAENGIDVIRVIHGARDLLNVFR